MDRAKAQTASGVLGWGLLTKDSTQRRVSRTVFAGTAALGGILGACGSPANSPSEASWTLRPTATSLQDSGTAYADGATDANRSADANGPADADGEAETPEVLCDLTGPPAATAGDTLVYADDFDGNAVDPARWNLRTGAVGPTNVLNAASPSNAAVHDGSLFIKSELAPPGSALPYVSAYVDSLGKFARTYGKIEFRARFPYAPGTWSSMWGRPWSQPFPEIDIEVLNKVGIDHSQLYFVNHWAAPPIPADQRRIFALIEGMDFSAFHVYTVFWKPGLVEWRVDGVPKMQSTAQGVPNLPVYWIFDGWVGGWSGPPPSSTSFPITFEVDYFHVYRVDGLIAAPLIAIVDPGVAPAEATRSTLAKTDKLAVATANFDEACVHVEMYDGDTLVKTVSTAPYQFRMSALASGAHKLSFVATDGARRTSTAIDVQIH